MTDKQTIDIYDAQAQTYADRFSKSEPDADLRAFMEAVTPGGAVLDLGCGPGHAAAMMRSAGFSVTATDASPGMVRLARENHGLEAELATFDDLQGTDIFDGIWANFSLLHAPKSEMPRHLDAIRAALKPGGTFHIGLKVGEDAARDKIGRMYSYYGVEELRSLLEAAGFSVRSVREGSEPGLSGEVSPYVIMLCDG